jgi:hypothetical protein
VELTFSKLCTVIVDNWLQYYFHAKQEMVHLEMGVSACIRAYGRNVLYLTTFIPGIFYFFNFVHCSAFKIKTETTFRGQVLSLSSDKGVREAPYSVFLNFWIQMLRIICLEPAYTYSVSCI